MHFLPLGEQEPHTLQDFCIGLHYANVRCSYCSPWSVYKKIALLNKLLTVLHALSIGKKSEWLVDFLFCAFCSL